MLIALSLKYNGDYGKMISAISKEELDIPTEFEEKVDSVNCITLLDANYPEKLKQSFQPPIVLYYYGNLDLLNDDNIIYVCGGRNMSNGGRKDTRKLIHGLDATVLIGLNGSPTSLTDIVLSESKRIIGVLPYGINYKGIPLDVENISHILKKDGLILSEYPLETPKSIDTCSGSKRIRVGSCDKMLLIEAKKNSGLLLDVNLCLNANKNICVVPKSLSQSDNYLNNDLIYEGATPCYKQEQLKEMENCQ
jgi:DNA processing protein